MKELTVPDQRLLFVQAVQRDGLSITAACRHFAISRVTGYKILRRFEEHGAAGLSDHSRAPHHCPHAVGADWTERILALKAVHHTWRPKKLRAFFARTCPAPDLPAVSTFGEVLKRAGLVKPRRTKPRSFYAHTPLTQAQEANHVWCIDYKGQFLLQGSGSWCYPLTLTDECTRFLGECTRLLIRCQALPDTKAQTAWPCLVGAFQEFGLPHIIRSDNGTPFASASLTGLTPLSVQFLKLGMNSRCGCDPAAPARTCAAP
jgi:transposase